MTSSLKVIIFLFKKKILHGIRLHTILAKHIYFARIVCSVLYVHIPYLHTHYCRLDKISPSFIITIRMIMA